MSDDEAYYDEEKMGLTGCGKFLKYSMSIFNIIILICGCGILGFGVYSRTNESNLTRISAILGSFYYDSLSWALIGIGGLVILLAFLGCCGAIKEVKCMLGMFFVLLLVMLLGMVAGGITIYVLRDKINIAILNGLSHSLNTSYGMPGKTSVTEAWDVVQTIFKCCGVQGGINSTTSWAYYKKMDTPWFLNFTDENREYVPKSCCINNSGENRTRCVGGGKYRFTAPVQGPPVTAVYFNDLLFVDGCYSAILDFLAENVNIVAAIVAVVGALMILGMTFSICLCRRIQDDFLYD